jgi:ABC-2 type transport system permease protein
MPIKQQFIALITIINKEITRILRIWPQTLIPPVITTSLYFVIFGTYIGSRVGEVQGIPYMSFIMPGLIMLGVINNSYSNVVSSFFGAKFQKFIQEMLVSPTPNWVILLGHACGGVFRGVVIGVIIWMISLFFVPIQIANPLIVVGFIFLTSLLFSLGGLLNGTFARSFDDMFIFPTFVLTPLTYLGGVFYSIKQLPEVWQNVSRLNPILYLVDGFRYGFFGASDINIWLSFGLLIVMIGILFGINWYILNKGIGMKD